MEMLQEEKDYQFGVKARKALLLWASFLSVAGIIFFLLLPTRFDLRERMTDWRFFAEALIWLPTMIASACLAFRNTSRDNPSQGAGAFPLFAPFLLVMMRIHQHSHLSDPTFFDEMDLYRGRCGIIILGTAATTAILGLTLIRRLLSFSELEIGSWAFFSAGAFASFLMQFVCAHEEPLHMFIWHFTPMMLLAVIGLKFEKRALNVGVHIPVRRPSVL